MNDIPFTQYILPTGRKEPVFAPMPEGFETKVETILQSGFVFEAEVLTTGTVSLTVSDGEEDIAIELSCNGPEIDEALKRLINAAYTYATLCKTGGASPQRPTYG